MSDFGSMQDYHHRDFQSQHQSDVAVYHYCDMTTLAKRLFEARTAKGMTQPELARAANVKSQSTIGMLESGAHGSSAYIPAIAAVLGIPALWLAEGRGPKALGEAPGQSASPAIGAPPEPPDTTPKDADFALVPQLDLSASCGHGKFAEHVVVKGGLAFKRSSLRDIGVNESGARIIYASGQSMEPAIKHGRVVLVDVAQNTAVDNKIFLICDPDGAIYLKRLVREYHPQTGEMAWIMRSDNANKLEHPDKLLPQDSRTTIVGRAVWTDTLL